MKKIIGILAASTLFLCGCSNDTNEAYDLKKMNFEAVHPNLETRIQGNSFETGDCMGVFVTKYKGENAAPLELSGNYANNVAVRFDGKSWNCDRPIYWEEGKFDVYAYYPYTKPNSVDEYEFSVQLNQSAENNTTSLNAYEESDLLWCKKEGVAETKRVPLLFKHKLSKLTVKLVKGKDFAGEIPDDIVVRIHNTVPTALIDLATGSVTKHPYQLPKAIQAKKLTPESHTAILVPQRLESKRPLIEVITKGVSYLVESRFYFKEGVEHTIQVTLNNSPDRIKINIGGEIESGWNE